MNIPTTLGIIPARGGSKGIKDKNIIDVGGRPLIDWTIQVAVQSGVLDRLIVSTDAQAIAEVAVNAGAEVPFLRPANIAGDTATSIEVVLHSLQFLAENDGYRPDYVMLLQPTSPLRTAADIMGAFGIIQEKNVESVVSVTKADSHPDTFFKIGKNKRLAALSKNGNSVKPSRRQDYEPVFVPNGAIYLVKTDVLEDGRDWYNSDVYGYIMSPEHSIDIDTNWDLSILRLIVENKLLQTFEAN